MLKVAVKRKDKPPMTAWFETTEQVEIFHQFIKDLIMSVEVKAAKTHEEKLQQIRQILQEIARGEGAYSRDRLTHCENCVENMKNLAKKALTLLEEA